MNPSDAVPSAGGGAPAYLAGLLLHGRRVVVVGGGHVAARRVPKLVAAGARVEVIAPAVHPELRSLAEAGALSWQSREFTASDLDGAWYALAATDSAAVNAAVAAASEQRHTFCVRADRADAGSAWTPATGTASGVTVAVLTGHDPLRARRIRDRLVEIVVQEEL